MTVMGEAMTKAGIMPPEMRLTKLIEAVPPPRTTEKVEAALIASKDVEAALCLVDPQVVASRVRARIKDLERAGQGAFTDKRHNIHTRPSDNQRPGDTSPTAGSRVWSPKDIERAARFPGHAKRTTVPTAVSGAIMKGIFEREIGSGKKKLGDITKFDVLQIKRRGLIDNTIADGLLELEWPDDQKTRLMDFASEDQVTAIYNRAYRVLDQLGLTHASA